MTVRAARSFPSALSRRHLLLTGSAAIGAGTLFGAGRVGAAQSSSSARSTCGPPAPPDSGRTTRPTPSRALSMPARPPAAASCPCRPALHRRHDSAQGQCPPRPRRGCDALPEPGPYVTTAPPSATRLSRIQIARVASPWTSISRRQPAVARALAIVPSVAPSSAMAASSAARGGPGVPQTRQSRSLTRCRTHPRQTPWPGDRAGTAQWKRAAAARSEGVMKVLHEHDPNDYQS
jgi:hypothetical protein